MIVIESDCFLALFERRLKWIYVFHIRKSAFIEKFVLQKEQYSKSPRENYIAYYEK